DASLPLQLAGHLSGDAEGEATGAVRGDEGEGRGTQALVADDEVHPGAAADLELALVLRAQQLLGQDLIAPAEAKLEAEGAGALAADRTRAGIEPGPVRLGSGGTRGDRRPGDDRSGRWRGRGDRSSRGGRRGNGANGRSGGHRDDPGCLGERRGRRDTLAVGVRGGHGRSRRLRGGGGERDGGPGSGSVLHLDQRVAVPDLVTERQGALVQLVPVDEGASATDVDDEQLAVR